MSKRAMTKAAVYASRGELPTYAVGDGSVRHAVVCKPCHGYGRWDWRDQRRAGLSAKQGDAHVTCPKCRGVGITIERVAVPDRVPTDEARGET